MLSSLNLAYIHLRLQELFGNTNWFGSKNVLFVGDIMQLPPVNGSPVYTKVQNKVIASRLGCMTAVNIWKQTIVYDELVINEHQKKDHKFVKILDEVCQGCVSEDSLDCLRQRVIDGTVMDKFIELYT